MNKKLEEILDEFAHTQGNQNWKKFKAEFPGEADRVIKCFEKAFVAGQESNLQEIISNNSISTLRKIKEETEFKMTKTDDKKGVK